MVFLFFELGLNPIQDRVGEHGGGGAKKASPTRFSPVTSTNVGISSPKLCDF